MPSTTAVGIKAIHTLKKARYPMLTVEEAENLTSVVAKDPEASKRIDSGIDNFLPAAWGVAGGLRNAGYVALGMVSFGAWGDPTEPAYANRVCTGISDAASAALNVAVSKKEARVRRLKGAAPISRVLNGVDHTAVQVSVDDGQQHVFDWHATLDADNPMLFRSPADWVRAKDGVPLKDFSGWK
tara:strand:- start:957 stop:1508 length:552 start_codon:yes stop_codon:yes gene_type:complete